MTKEKELSFEEALKKLEKIADELQEEDISLDISIKRYEEGMKLISVCHKKLEEAKKKVELLVRKEGGKFQLKSFDESSMEEDGKEL
ncbi:MAG: exodeoxyribonuclease VII small subunit [Candidatus Omnitrophica bacterium]|nr:exodeoxyribonuclease VII small subunit [Candidatus Omnitrophota bacterium]MBU1925024.1 exodeoxyribonuclease VII small subunit [Candidatus Omnitrophota bacterium]MBU2064115.1 exodeoxyribonuclease VII small subunit [Candidatus Omnitrophota bacterium]